MGLAPPHRAPLGGQLLLVLGLLGSLGRSSTLAPSGGIGMCLPVPGVSPVSGLPLHVIQDRRSTTEPAICLDRERVRTSGISLSVERVDGSRE